MFNKPTTKTITKLAVVLLTVVVLFSSWTALHPLVSREEIKESINDLDSLTPFIIRSRVKVIPLEKKDIIVMYDGRKIEGKATEVRVMEIKYLDGKNRIPVKILSIKRY